MSAHVIVTCLELMFVSLLFKTNAHICSIGVEQTERQLDDPFDTIDNKECNKQALLLL